MVTECHPAGAGDKLRLGGRAWEGSDGPGWMPSGPVSSDPNPLSCSPVGQRGRCVTIRALRGYTPLSAAPSVNLGRAEKLHHTGERHFVHELSETVLFYDHPASNPGSTTDKLCDFQQMT